MQLGVVGVQGGGQGPCGGRAGAACSREGGEVGGWGEYRTSMGSLETGATALVHVSRAIYGKVWRCIWRVLSKPQSCRLCTSRNAAAVLLPGAVAHVIKASPPAHGLVAEYTSVISASASMHRHDLGKPMIASDAVGTLLQQSADQAAANSTHNTLRCLQSLPWREFLGV
jgi:hypothetical protein